MSETWQPRTVGESVRITKGVTYASSDYASENDGHVFLTIKCFAKGGGFNTEGIKYFRGIYSPEQEIQPGELLVAKTDLTRDGDIIGSPMIVPDFGDGRKVLPSMDLSVMRPLNEDTDLRFLFYRLMLGDARRFMWAHSAGSTVLHLESKSLPKFSFRAPRRGEQRRIAEILSTVDEAIEQTETLIAKYQQIKAGLMHDLFTRGLTSDGHLRPTRAQAPHLYKESPLGWIPKEWEVSKLRDKSSPVRPHIKTGPFGSSLKGEHWVENGRPVITIGALGEGKLLTEGLLFVSEATAHRLRDYQLQPGDVVFSRVADVGRSAVICEEHDGWIMSSNLMRISLNQNLIVPGYLQAQFAFDHRVKAQIRAKVNSGGRDVANGQILNQLQFAWPRHEEQHVALKRIRALDANRRNVIDQQTKLLKLKQGLMHDLLTGRVRVKVDKSASA